MRALRLSWLEFKLAWYRWAAREISPLHADVPHLVCCINRLECELRAVP